MPRDIFLDGFLGWRSSLGAYDRENGLQRVFAGLQSNGSNKKCRRDVLSRQDAFMVKYKVEKSMWYSPPQDEVQTQQAANKLWEAI